MVSWIFYSLLRTNEGDRIVNSNGFNNVDFVFLLRKYFIILVWFVIFLFVCLFGWGKLFDHWWTDSYLVNEKINIHHQLNHDDDEYCANWLVGQIFFFKNKLQVNHAQVFFLSSKISWFLVINLTSLDFTIQLFNDSDYDLVVKKSKFTYFFKFLSWQKYLFSHISLFVYLYDTDRLWILLLIITN